MRDKKGKIQKQELVKTERRNWYRKEHRLSQR